MIADRRRALAVLVLALVIRAILAPVAAWAVPGAPQPGLYAYDETGTVLTHGFAQAIDREGAAALAEAGAPVYVYAAASGDPAALADDVARSWGLPADAVVIGVVRDPAALAVRPAGRLDAAGAAAIEQRVAGLVAHGDLAAAAVTAARQVRAAIEPSGAHEAARRREHTREAVIGGIVLVVAALAASIVLWARGAGPGRGGGRPDGASAAAAGRLADPAAPEGRLLAASVLELRDAGAIDPETGRVLAAELAPAGAPAMLLAAAGGRVDDEALADPGVLAAWRTAVDVEVAEPGPGDARLATGLAAVAAVGGLVLAAVALVVWDAWQPALVLLVAGLLAALPLALAARGIRRDDDRGLAWRVYGAMLDPVAARADALALGRVDEPST